MIRQPPELAEVVVTGVGAVCCHGRGNAALWQAMTAGNVPVPDRPADALAKMAAPLIHLVPDTEGVRRAASFGVAAAREAVAEAGLDLPDGTAVVVGSCVGEPGVNEHGRGDDGWSHQFTLAADIAAALGVVGSAVDIANACAAGGYAVGTGVDLIRAGEADVVLAGGVDSYSRVALGAFNRLGAVDTGGCRPFHRDRAGTVIAEGAGFLVLESARHAAARGACGAVRVADVGWSCDAGHPTAPDPDGVQVERAALAALGGDAAIGCVIPHGTGTPSNDEMESLVLQRILDTDVATVPAYSLKALLGHTGGASAALGAVAAVLVLRAGTVPGNIPLTAQDPGCAMWLPTEAVPLATPRVLVNGYGFGGNNAAMVLEAAG